MFHSIFARHRPKRLPQLLTAIALAGLAGSVSAVTVQGTDSIYNSGSGSTPRTTVALGGATSFAVGASGAITVSDPVFNNADGVGSLNIAHNISGVNGLSGISLPTGRAGALVGVFLGATDPPSGGVAPASLSYALGNLADLSYAPLLNQVFFIGDGLTGDGAGTSQTFFAPVGATRLGLGFADAPGYSGSPGAYFDNRGSFDVTVTPLAAVPEPASWAMMLAGLGVVGIGLRRRAPRFNGPAH